MRFWRLVVFFRRWVGSAWESSQHSCSGPTCGSYHPLQGWSSTRRCCRGFLCSSNGAWDGPLVRGAPALYLLRDDFSSLFTSSQGMELAGGVVLALAAAGIAVSVTFPSFRKVVKICEWSPSGRPTATPSGAHEVREEGEDGFDSGHHVAVGSSRDNDLSRVRILLGTIIGSIDSIYFRKVEGDMRSRMCLGKSVRWRHAY